MKTKWMIAAAIPVLLAGAALAAPSFIDWEQYKPQIISGLTEATGHEYAINGPIKLSILPYPRALIESVSVAQPQSMGGATLASMERASVSVALLPLLQKKVKVNTIVLEKPVISLGIDRAGNPSWMTPELSAAKDEPPAQQATAQEQKAGMGDSFSFDSVKIKDGSFTFDNLQKGSKIVVNGINTEVKADTLSGPFDAKGDLLYNDAKVGLEVKTGRLSSGSDNVSLQAKITLPGDGNVTFSGVADMKDGMDVQGETAFATQNLSATLAPFMKQAPAGLNKPMSVDGMITASPEAFALRNAVMKWDGSELAGSISAANLKNPPLVFDVTLQSDKPFNADSLLTGGAGGAKASAGGKSADKAKGPLLPQTVSLPMPMQGTVNVKMNAVTYKGVAFNALALNAKLADKTINTTLKSGLPGQGNLEGTFDLAFASASANEASGSIILSDPTLNYRVTLDTKDPNAVLKPFVPADTLKKAGAVLSSDMAVDVKGNIKGNAVTAEAGSFRIMETPIAFSGSYRPAVAAGGRDKISVTASTDNLDADAFLNRMAPQRGQEAATKAADAQKQKADVAAMAKSFALPFDLDLGASVKTLRFRENQYDNIAVKGTLEGDALSITNAGFSDENGNRMAVTGSVGSLKALSAIDLNINANTPDAEKLLAMFKVDTSKFGTKIGSAELLSQFKGQADKLSFTANAKALGGSLEASGALADLLETPAFSDLTMRLRHPNYVQVVQLVSPEFKGSVDIRKDLDLYASMQRENKTYKLNQLNAKVGPATITGTISADMSGAKPDIVADLKLGDFPIDKLLGIEAGNKKGTVQATRTTQQGAATSGNSRWSHNAINTAWMHKNNLKLNATATSASYGPWKFTDAVIATTLKDGTLDLSKMTGKMYGGDMAFTAKLTAPAAERQPLSLTATADLNNVALQEFVTSFSGSQLVKARGTINFDANLASTGISPSAIVYALNGKATATGSDLVMEGFDLARMSRTLASPSSSGTENIQNLLGATMQGGSTSFDKLDGAFTITEGVINFDKMDLTGDAADIATLGNVNLPLWTVNLESTISLAEPADAPPLKISFKGPLDNPGQTFGRSVLDGYLRQKLVAPLQDKLQDKLQEELGDKLNIPGLFGGSAAKPKAAPVPKAATTTAPAAAPAVAPAPAAAVAPAPAPVVAPTPAPEATPADIAPAASPEPAPVPASEPEPVAAPAPAPEPAAEPAAAQPTTPEDAFMGILQNAIQN